MLPCCRMTGYMGWGHVWSGCSMLCMSEVYSLLLLLLLLLRVLLLLLLELVVQLSWIYDDDSSLYRSIVEDNMSMEGTRDNGALRKEGNHTGSDTCNEAINSILHYFSSIISPKLSQLLPWSCRWNYHQKISEAHVGTSRATTRAAAGHDAAVAAYHQIDLLQQSLRLQLQLLQRREQKRRRWTLPTDPPDTFACRGYEPLPPTRAIIMKRSIGFKMPSISRLLSSWLKNNDRNNRFRK